MRLDGLDRAILQILRVDGRVSNVELSDRVGLSPSACLRRVQRLEKDRFITGYSAQIDEHAAEGSITVFVRLTLDSQSGSALQEFELAVEQNQRIEDCHLLSGQSDYLMRLRVKDLAAYETFHRDVLSLLPNVSNIQSNFSLREIKSELSAKL